jgi:twitching motility protein PilT
MKIPIVELFTKVANEGGSDIFLIGGQPFSYKLNTEIIEIEEYKIMPDDATEILEWMYEKSVTRDISHVKETGDDDFSFALPGVARFRVSAFKQRGTLAAVIRIVPFNLPNPTTLGIPEIVIDQGVQKNGLVLVTGPADSGKSTTLACIIDQINKTANKHIITIEDPIEYLFRHDHSIISQREIGLDTTNHASALRAALRQAPDVILIGELRDFETIEIAMTAAETGILVISTLHTIGASDAVDRIIDVFPDQQQRQIRIQLAMILRSVISQQLVPQVGGGVVPAYEIMLANDAIKNMIRESKIHQIDSVIASSKAEGMVPMDEYLMSLEKDEKISKDDAIRFAWNSKLMEKRLGATL